MEHYWYDFSQWGYYAAASENLRRQLPAALLTRMSLNLSHNIILLSPLFLPSLHYSLVWAVNPYCCVVLFSAAF